MPWGVQEQLKKYVDSVSHIYKMTLELDLNAIL